MDMITTEKFQTNMSRGDEAGRRRDHEGALEAREQMKGHFVAVRGNASERGMVDRVNGQEDRRRGNKGT